MRGKKNQGAALRFALSAAFALTFVVAFFFPGPRIAYAMDMKAKPSASAPSNATIYFFRLEGLITPYSPDIKVDGRVVGKMPGGTYFVVNRPAGHHTIGIDAGTMDGGWESEVDWASGQTYYIEVGTKQTYGGFAQQALVAMLANTPGKLMPGHGLFAFFSFYALDAERARAEIAKMKSAKR